MSIVDMSKIKLVGLNFNKEDILNALSKTGCVEISETEEFADTFCVPVDDKRKTLTPSFDRLAKSIEFISDVLDKYKDADFYPQQANAYLKNFFVGYDSFMSIKDKEEELFEIVKDTEEYNRIFAENKSLKIKHQNLINQIIPYYNCKNKFTDFCDTKYTKVFFGLLKQDNLNPLRKALTDYSLVQVDVLVDAPVSVISVISEQSQAQDVAKILSDLSFSACPFDYNCNAKEKVLELRKQIASLDKKDLETTKKICKSAVELGNLKVLCDYYRFMIEKANNEQNFRCTSQTFVLEGFVPTENVDFVVDSIKQISNAVFIEVCGVTEQDNPPTLCKNNPVVRQAEFVTDMYSVPAYNEIDPSKSVFFFFMLFMGVIMADVGYGLLMITVGLFLARRIKVDTGARRLWYLIAIGGVFAIIFGLLFNSFFGLEIFRKSVLPSPVPSGSDNEGLMTILLSCLGLGVIHIAYGYFLKALNSFKHGNTLDGILDGIVWVVFFIGLIMATFNFLMDYFKISVAVNLRKVFDVLTIPGLVLVIGAVLVSAVTAGRKEKGFGKFTKGFGAVYGLINIMSDILSYARLFGLMLSGMIIAQTFNDIGGGIIAGGGIGYVLGALVIALGHTFNIAMGVLGAYIHDSRLQYIEYFSRFYTGEGKKFRPLGSDLEYIYLSK